MPYASCALRPSSSAAPQRVGQLRLEVDIRHGKVVGIADDVGDAAIFFDGP